MASSRLMEQRTSFDDTPDLLHLGQNFGGVLLFERLVELESIDIEF